MSTDDEKCGALKMQPPKDASAQSDNDSDIVTFEDASFDATPPLAGADAGDHDDDNFVDCESQPTATDKEVLIEDDGIDFSEEVSVRHLEGLLSDGDKEVNRMVADRIKGDANKSFKEGNYVRSTDLYTKALDMCPVVYKKTRAILYANRSASKVKLGGCLGDAIVDCNRALYYWPEYVKALVRRGKLYEDTDKLDEALADFTKAVELDGTNVEARDALPRLNAKIAQRNEEMKEKMVGQLKNLGNMILKPFGLSTNNFQMVQDPNTGSYSINMKQ